MRRIPMTLVLVGLCWFWPACAGRSNNDVPRGMGGTKAEAGNGAGGVSNAQGSQAPVPGGMAHGGTAVAGGGSEAGLPTGGDSSSASSGGVATAGADATGDTGGAGGDSGGLFNDDESSTFANNVFAQLNGSLFLAPCEIGQDTRVCYVSTKLCPQNDDPALAGLLMTDRTLELGGNPAFTYELTLHIQGLTEAKSYKSGMDQSSTGTQAPADGLYTDGKPDPSNARDVFMIRVGAPAHDYFLNSIATESDTRLRYSVFPVDYTAKIRVQGGTTVRLVAADSNCGISRNCADSGPEYECRPLSAANLEPKLAQQIGKQQPYDGQFLGIVVTDIAIVQ